MMYSGQLRDVITGAWRSIRGFRGAIQQVPLTDGFWQGRQWRAYYEFDLDAGDVHTIRFTANKPFLLQGQELYLDNGQVRAVVRTLPTTQPGPWVGLSTRFNKNQLLGPVALNSTIELSTAVDAVTGGLEREVLRTKAGANRNPGLGHGNPGWRALPAGVYFIRLNAVTASTGMYGIEVEELPDLT